VPLLYLILDEATQIKNADAQRTEAAKALNAVHRVCLSGTPVENRPLELWSLFDFLMRGHLGTASAFERKFEQPIIAGERSAAEKLSRRISPFILRRLKKLQMTEWCELTEEQRRLYVGLQNEHKGIVESLKRGEKVDIVTNILPLLTKLKQVCDHPAIVTGQLKPYEGRSSKFDMVVEKIKGIRDSGEQVVIFSHFLSTLDLLQLAVENLGIRFIRIDGSTNNRQLLIDAFNQGKATAALCSIQACGHGVNLTGANHVIHFDRWWNPAIEDQATDRVHRIGQDKTVYVYRFLVQDTIEEKIDMLLERKRGIANLIVGGDWLSSKRLTRDELLEILQPLK
jgi:SNF2 family DNA or RNA helicase